MKATERATASRVATALAHAGGGGIGRQDAYALIQAPDEALPELLATAAELRDARKGRIASYSRKVFLPLTNLCRDTCGYCTFVRQPGDTLAHTMSIEEVLAVARAGQDLGHLRLGQAESPRDRPGRVARRGQAADRADGPRRDPPARAAHGGPGPGPPGGPKSIPLTAARRLSWSACR